MKSNCCQLFETWFCDKKKNLLTLILVHNFAHIHGGLQNIIKAKIHYELFLHSEEYVVKLNKQIFCFSWSVDFLHYVKLFFYF